MTIPSWKIKTNDLLLYVALSGDGDDVVAILHASEDGDPKGMQYLWSKSFQVIRGTPRFKSLESDPRLFSTKYFVSWVNNTFPCPADFKSEMSTNDLVVYLIARDFLTDIKEIGGRWELLVKYLSSRKYRDTHYFRIDKITESCFIENKSLVTNLLFYIHRIGSKLLYDRDVYKAAVSSYVKMKIAMENTHPMEIPRIIHFGEIAAEAYWDLTHPTP